MLTERTFPDRPGSHRPFPKKCPFEGPNSPHPFEGPGRSTGLSTFELQSNKKRALQLINMDTQWCTILGSCLSERDIDQHRFAPTCAIYPLNLVSGQTWELWRAATCRLSCATSWVWEQTAANAFHIDVSIWVWFQHVSTWVFQNGIFSLWQLATQSGSLWARTNISWFVAVGCAPSLLSAVDSARKRICVIAGGNASEQCITGGEKMPVSADPWKLFLGEGLCPLFLGLCNINQFPHWICVSLKMCIVYIIYIYTDTCEISDTCGC